MYMRRMDGNHPPIFLQKNSACVQQTACLCRQHIMKAAFKGSEQMEDRDIIELYWARSEEAIRATAAKSGVYCGSIIRRILGDGRDSEECLNDTWMGVWNAIPPQLRRTNTG